MSQNIWDSIVPSVTSGNQLATLLNDFKDAVISGMSGAARPSEIDPGGLWIDTSDDGIGLWYFKVYTGVTDILIAKINKNTGVATIPGADSDFDILKSSDDSVGPTLNLLKKRIAGGGQTLIGDVLGEVNFVGHTNIAGEEIQAVITSQSVNDVSSTQKGANLIFKTTKFNTNQLLEKMRLTHDGKLGIGENAPSKTAHFVGNDSTAGIMAERLEDSTEPSKISAKKKRVTGSNGQVLSGDEIGQFSVYSTDENGAEQEVARIKSVATENTSTTGHGNKLIFSVKKIGETTFTDVMEMTDSGISVLGLPVSGKYVTYANEAITGGGNVSKSDTVPFQYRRVSGNGGPVTLSTTPFGSLASMTDGTIIKIIGTDDTNTVSITDNDIQYGARLQGDKELKKYEYVELQYDAVLERLIEVGSNVI